MPTLVLSTAGKTLHLTCTAQQSVLEALTTAQIKISSACAGHGFCGLCKITLQAGVVSQLTAIEQDKLSQSQIAQGTRLACQVYPGSDLTLTIENTLNTLSWKRLSSLDKILLNEQDSYAIALDLGTTQLRLSLWNLTQQRRVMAWLIFNPQYQFGADILNRLTAAQSLDNATEMLLLIQQAIKKIIRVIAKLIPLAQLKKFYVVGNTAMLALLAQKNYLSLLNPTYWSQYLDCTITSVSAWQTALGLTATTDIATVPPLAGFIGSDLLAGLFSTGLMRDTRCRLLIDFGTNSEMALWDGSKLWISSVPGGPAFEGCGISCGMPVGEGAIYQIAAPSSSNWDYKVIGHSKPLGLCGSGLVDVIAHLISTRQLQRNGRFTTKEAKEISLPLSATVALAIKKQDIDIFQQAKAATGAAIVQLFKQSGVPLAAIETLFVCGAFGQFLTIENAQAIGLLPPLAAEKIQLYQNSALKGCELLLSRPQSLGSLSEIRAKTTLLNMSYVLNFDECFVENLYLQPMQF